MTTIEPTRTLAELVTTRPNLAAPLDALGLDYCCGGRRTLAAAVTAAGLELDAVIARLEEAAAEQPGEVDWAGLDPAGLVDHLESTHHAYLDQALPRLTALAEKVAGVHGARHPELHQVRGLVDALRTDLEPHLRREEQVLFPMIRQLVAAHEPPRFHCGSLENPITVMLAEHDHAGELLADLRAATGGFEAPADACRSYRALFDGLAELEADVHLHVHKENNVLFPEVAALERRLAEVGP
jgi:regulator of cell morphogenesis and NO signaling